MAGQMGGHLVIMRREEIPPQVVLCEQQRKAGECCG